MSTCYCCPQTDFETDPELWVFGLQPGSVIVIAIANGLGIDVGNSIGIGIVIVIELFTFVAARC